MSQMRTHVNAPALVTPPRTAAGMALAFLLGALVFAATFLLVRHFRTQSDEPLLPIGQRPAGEIEMPVFRRADGTPGGAGAENELWKLSDRRGHVVLVNYFSTWCPPCIAEMPDLVKLSKEYAASGVDFVLVALDQEGETPGAARADLLNHFAQQYGVTFPMLLPAADSPIWRANIVRPQTFLYDKAGHRARSIVGQVDEATLRQSLETLLREPPTAAAGVAK